MVFGRLTSHRNEIHQVGCREDELGSNLRVYLTLCDGTPCIKAERHAAATTVQSAV